MLNQNNNLSVLTFSFASHCNFSLVYDAESLLPSNGGLRLCEYQNNEEAIEENILLANLMNKKHKIYNTGFSGGKIVVNSCPNKIEKDLLLKSIAVELNKLNGKMYTGCDININNRDIELLYKDTKYVLAGMNSKHDPNVATAYGVFGSIKALLQSEKLEFSKFASVMVVGCGQVGSCLAKLLVEKNFNNISTIDVISSRANIYGTCNISSDCWKTKHADILVLCSKSKVITPEIARNLSCKVLVSSANAPFSDDLARMILQDRGILVIPDVISNSGAVICDSIEHYNSSAFINTSSKNIYKFVEQLVLSKTSEFINSELNGNEAVNIEKFYETPSSTFCGNLFSL